MTEPAMAEVVRDRYGNEIYLTDERWDHIIEHHPSMAEYRDHLLLALRTGRRKQDPLDPSKFKYDAPFTDLELHYNHIVAVVKFSEREMADGRTRSNNFVLTAYPVFIRGRR